MKNRIVRCLPIFIIFCLAGCASGPAYLKNGYFRRTQGTIIDGNTIQILYKGNWMTRRELAERAILLRAADETLKHNFNYFEFVDLQEEGLALRKEVIGIAVPQPTYFTCRYPDLDKIRKAKFHDGAKFFIKCYKDKVNDQVMDAEIIVTYVSFKK